MPATSSGAASCGISAKTRLEVVGGINEIDGVLRALTTRLTAAIGQRVQSARRAVTETLRPSGVAAGFVADLFRTREELLAENAALRQQLIVASRKVSKPLFRAWERGLLVALASRMRAWRDAIFLIKPDTVRRWHREGFRLLWKHKTKRKGPRKSRLSSETVELIQTMARDKRTWGAERIRGELLKLGTRVAKRTIQRHIVAVRPPGDGQSWKTFLGNHTVWACDFLQAYDVWFRPLFAFFVVDVNTKAVVHVAVTREPSEAWTAQRLRQITPFGEGPQFIIRDRDAKFGAEFDRVAKGAGINILKTAVRAPLMNSTCERFLGSVRRECLDHIIILGEEPRRHPRWRPSPSGDPRRGSDRGARAAPSAISRRGNHDEAPGGRDVPRAGQILPAFGPCHCKEHKRTMPRRRSFEA